ncbi:MAG: SecDF P1 head subdomain-containing protein, partial [Solirubrobacteraceae bacterium]
MTHHDDPVIAELAAANPVAVTGRPGAAEREAATRVLLRVLEVDPAPPRTGWRSSERWRGVGQAAGIVASALVVLAVVAALIRFGGTGQSAGQASGGRSQATLTLTFQALPTPQVPRITSNSLDRVTQAIRARLAIARWRGSVSASGHDRLTVVVSGIPAHDRAAVEEAIGAPQNLAFYDWEADVLTPNGRTVAGQLPNQDPAALQLSTGASAGQPGAPAAGGLPLYRAVKLASSRPAVPLSRYISRKGAQYYLFGAPGSAACTAAKADGMPVVPGEHCLLAGPADTLSALDQALPAEVSRSEGQLLTVRQGTVVLQAANPTASDVIPFTSPQARFFVLRDHVALFGVDITNPVASTDSWGSPAVRFGFTAAGRRAFQKLTATIAHRGQDVSVGGQKLYQHFAVAVDGQLVTIPQINFEQYPDGVIGANGADITGALTRNSAREIAAMLRL